MAGKTPQEITRLDLGEQALEDIFQSLAKTWYDKDHFEESVENLKKNLPPKLEQLAKFLGERKFVLGDRISYVDFFIYSVVDYIRLFKPELLENQATLNAFLDRIEALPAINAYIKSDKFYRMPITGPMSKWGFQKE